MQITQEAPSLVRRKQTSHRSYRALFEALKQNPDTWLRVHADEIGGDEPVAKRARLCDEAMTRKIKIQTAMRGEWLYLRMVTPEETR